MDWKGELKRIYWEEGLRIQLPPNSYRTAATVICAHVGRQRAEFANGVFPYFALVQIIRPDGSSIMEGNNIIPVLPDGRLLMIVEQRPGISFFSDQPRVVSVGNRQIDLGAYGSLEFPGGAVDAESIICALFRELQEETGIEDQEALLFRRLPPLYPMIANVIGRMYISVAYLSNAKFTDYVESDGGLRVLALHPSDVRTCIRNGVITSGETAVSGWHFYQEVEQARLNRGFLEEMQHDGYVSVETVKIKR